jgi:two-component system, NarL family, sensor histidine kinase DesK
MFDGECVRGVTKGSERGPIAGSFTERPGHTLRNQQAKKVGPTQGKRNDWWDFIWLVYSVFFFIEPLNRHSRSYWIQFSIFYALFVAIYTGMVFAKNRRTNYILLAAMWLLATIYVPMNQSAIGMFVYVAAFIPFITGSLAISLGTFAVVCATLTIEGFLFHLSPWSWAFGAFFSLVVGTTNLFTAQRLRANSKLQMAHEEIEQLAKVAERERIARDLHDVLGHTLSVIVLKSELAGRLFVRDPERAAAEITDVEKISRQALTEVRETIRGYRAEGLAAEIKRAHGVLDAAGVTLECNDKPPALKPAEESVMSLVLREAVTNIVRHSQASHCSMRFSAENGNTFFVVEDDGRGGARADGNGVRGMRERVEALGGRFNIGASEDGRGTRVTIELPAISPASALETESVALPMRSTR